MYCSSPLCDLIEKIIHYVDQYFHYLMNGVSTENVQRQIIKILQCSRSNTSPFVMKSNSNMAAAKTEINCFKYCSVYHYMCSCSSSVIRTRLNVRLELADDSPEIHRSHPDLTRDYLMP